MEFLKTATLAPMNSFGPVGMMVAVILWIVLFYMGYRYSITAQRMDGIGYVTCMALSVVLVAGLVLMLTTDIFSNPNNIITIIFAIISFLTFGSVGGFIAAMAAACGFMFGVLVRLLDRATQGTKR